MATEFDRLCREALSDLNMREQSHSLLLNEAQRNQDDRAATEAIIEISNIRASKQNLINEYNAEMARQQPRQAAYVSEEQRAARGPGELDVHDLAKICGITPEEYSRQYQGLANYKRTRGSERK
jgi:hypothetical protein